MGLLKKSRGGFREAIIESAWLEIRIVLTPPAVATNHSCVPDRLNMVFQRAHCPWNTLSLEHRPHYPSKWNRLRVGRDSPDGRGGKD